MTAVSIRLPDDVANRLNQLAALTGRSKSFYITEAILEHLDDLEDVYLAEKRLEDIRAGRSKTYTLEEVERDLGLAD
jgi:RHH-type rel operon transcriptional repressor/antitoxin RelB